MAILKGIEFTGPLGNHSAYRMKGVEGIVFRTKGGPTAKQIKKGKNFAGTRKTMSEFSGRSATSKWIMHMLQPLKALADYNIAGPLNGLVRPVQEMDTANAVGKRHVHLTKNPGILDGFSLNQNTILETIVRAPITCNMSRETLSAEVTIPALIPDINFKPHPKHQLYSFQVVLGVVPDMYHSTSQYYARSLSLEQVQPVLAESNWFSSQNGSEALKLVLKHNAVPRDKGFTLMLSVGIRYGMILGPDKIQQVKYAGAAKIVKAV